MFGLGPWELLLVVGVIMLLGGPSLVKKLFGVARDVQKVRSQLTPQALLKQVIDVDGEDTTDKQKPDKAKSKSAQSKSAGSDQPSGY